MEERRRSIMGQGRDEPAFDANGHAYVDLGLPSGTLWATEPVAGYNTNYTGYAWGDPNDEHSASLGQGLQVSHSYGSSGSATKYNNSDGLTEVLPEDDRVRIKWGGTWRTPSKAQFEELQSYCTYNSSMYSYTSNINGNSVSFGPFPYWTRTRATLYTNVFGGYYFNSNSLSTNGREYCYGFWGVLEPGQQTNSNDFTFGLSSSSTTVSSYQAGTTTVTLLKNGSALTDATQSEITVSGGDCSLSSFNSNTGVLTISYPANTGSSNTTRTVTITYKGKSANFTITQPYQEVFQVKVIPPVSDLELINPTNLSVNSAWGCSTVGNYCFIKFTLNGSSLSYLNGVSYTQTGDTFYINENPDNNAERVLYLSPSGNFKSHIYCSTSSWQNFKTITIPSPGHGGINKSILFFTVNTAGASLSLKITSSSESNYDFGAIGTLDNTSISSATANTIKNGTTTVAAKVSGVGSTQTVTFSNLTKGEHFVYICYAKDGSSSQGNDNCVIEETAASGDIMIQCTSSVTNYGKVIFTKNSSSIPIQIDLVGNTLRGRIWETNLMGCYVVLIGQYQIEYSNYDLKNIYNPIVYVDSNNAKVSLVGPSQPSSYNSSFDMYVWDVCNNQIKTINCAWRTRLCDSSSYRFFYKIYTNNNTNSLLALKTENQGSSYTLISVKANSSLTKPDGYVYVS